MATILIFPQETRPLRKVTCDCSGNGDCDNLLCWQHSANYLAGGDKPNYPVPAIRHTTELIRCHFDGPLQFFVMWQEGNVMFPVGDYPEYPLYI